MTKTRRNTLVAWVAAICQLILLLLSGSGPVSACCPCEYEWLKDSAITDPSITSPTASNNGIGINGEVSFTCSPCSDMDRVRYDCGDLEPSPDTVTYTWSGGGTFPYSNTGRTVTWKAPSTPGNYTVTVTVDDVDGHNPPGCGSDNDQSKQAHRTMQVVRIDAVNIYYHNDTTATQEYPLTTEDVTVRAVVRATHTSQSYYCNLTLQNNGYWYETGTGGDPLKDTTPPTLGGGVTTNTWPSNWPSVSFHWRTLPHQVDTETAKTGIQTYNQSYGPNECGLSTDGDVHAGNHTHKRRYFIYMDYQTPGSISNWGADDLHLARGTKRYQVTVKMHETEAWKQVVKSPGPTTTGQNQWSQDCDVNAEYPVRISVRNASLATDPNGREYLKWISAFVDVPYEWGGHWFGGKANATYDETYVDGTYAHYGIDCSGLVSIGAWFAGYNWTDPSWRAGTGNLSTADYTTARTKANCEPGDILNWPGHHVITIKTKSGDNITAIEAKGGSNKVISWTSTEDIDIWIDAGYEPRRLTVQE